jgi:hypothetical protein
MLGSDYGGNYGYLMISQGWVLFMNAGNYKKEFQRVSECGLTLVI